MTDNVEETVYVGARVPKSLADQLAEVARVNDRTVSGEVRLALRAHVKAGERAA